MIPFRPTSSGGDPVVTPRTSAAGLSVTLSVDIDEVLDALVKAEARRPPTGKILLHDEPATPPCADPPAVPAVEVLSHLYARDAEAEARFQRDVQTNARFLGRTRAGAIVRAVVGRTAALKGPADLATYRTIVGAGTWVWLRQAVCDTRSYQAGLDLGLLLLRVVDLHRPQLDPHECASHRRRLYGFVLDMLDRLDQWDAYLETWHRLRKHTADAVPLEPCARAVHGPAGRIPDFPVTRSHPLASWPSAANSSIGRTYRKTVGEESLQRSPVASR